MYSFTIFKMNIFHYTACSNLVLHLQQNFGFTFYILKIARCPNGHRHLCNQILHFTASMVYFPLYSLQNFPVLQSLFGLVSILHFYRILFYILQAHILSNSTARTLVIFHSKNASLRLYILHINPPLYLFICLKSSHVYVCNLGLLSTF